MEADNCFQNLRKLIISTFSVNENSLTELMEIFTESRISKNDYVSKEGDSSIRLAFICNGIIRAYYHDLKKNEIVRGFFCNGMFVVPLPPFVYRKPAFRNYQALTDTVILQAKYTELEQLARKHRSVNMFIRKLIESEWIINRELYETGIYSYSIQTRFGLFVSKFRQYIPDMRVEDISSYLQIPARQLAKMIDNELNKTV